jgi:UDP-N-acetylmuramoyl-tripeptide--D-alanyl-D-alanine ligase
VLNALAALGVAYLFGIEPVMLVEAVGGLRPVSQRGELVRLASGALVVNDCYNSNPDALHAMLNAVAAMPAQRRIAVLGGMMELGPASEELHRHCGRRAGELRFDTLLTVGDLARSFAEGAREAGLSDNAIVHCPTPEEAGEHLRDSLRQGDVVLLKASRAVHLERVWDRLGDRSGKHKIDQPGGLAGVRSGKEA